MALKKFLVISLIFSMFFFYTKDVFADDNIDFQVNTMINEVYDAMDQYEDLAGRIEEDEDSDELNQSTSNDSYWWPIGSSDTETSNGKTFANGDPETVTITSPFGYRIHPIYGTSNLHSGIDISGGSGMASVNIIAAKDGTVVFSSKGGTVCPSSFSDCSTCGGGYGNYIIIQHTDGNYTLYGHLYENSLTVSEGDSVTQGQVIAKMGSSGCSTGAHLHFEVREGQNEFSATVDPLGYVDPENPRPSNASSKLIEYIEQFEGHTKIIGEDSYLVENIGDGVRTVGKGVVLEYNASKFKAHGIDVNKYPVGSTIPIIIADAVKDEIISEDRSYIENLLSKNNITLKSYQVDALVSFHYNTGSVDDFPSAYKKYGNTQALYDNFFSKYVHVNDEVWEGLVSRRKSEWHLFQTGEYMEG